MNDEVIHEVKLCGVPARDILGISFTVVDDIGNSVISNCVIGNCVIGNCVTWFSVFLFQLASNDLPTGVESRRQFILPLNSDQNITVFCISVSAASLQKTGAGLPLHSTLKSRYRANLEAAFLGNLPESVLQCLYQLDYLVGYQ